MLAVIKKAWDFVVWNVLPYVFGGLIGIALGMVITDHIDLPSTGSGRLEDRIKTLTSSLARSAKTISQIEDEIDKRRALVDNLKADAEKAEKLKSLDSAQMEAVGQTLRGQLDAHYYRDLLVSGVVGAVSGKLLDLLMARWRRRPQA